MDFDYLALSGSVDTKAPSHLWMRAFQKWLKSRGERFHGVAEEACD